MDVDVRFAGWIDETCLAREHTLFLHDLVAEVGADFTDAAGGEELADVAARDRDVDLTGAKADVDIAETPVHRHLAISGLNVDREANWHFDRDVDRGEGLAAEAAGVRSELAPHHRLIA